MRRTAFRRLQTNIPIQWLLRDEFGDTRAAGAVNGTMPGPGPASAARLVVDSTNIMPLIAGELATTGQSVTSADPTICQTTPILRSPGIAFFVRFQRSSAYGGVNSSTAWGAYSATSGSFASGDHAFTFTGGTSLSVYRGGTGTDVYVIASDVYYNLVILLRATGAISFVDNLLVWVEPTGNSATLYSRTANLAGARMAYKLKFMRAANLGYLPPPLVSDGFGSSFGTSDGLGHAEGVSGGIGSGGGNRTPTQQIGTWANSAGKAAAATLSGGVAVATVPLSTADVFAKVKVTRSAGSGGMVLRWTDANNHLYTEHDGTNAYLKQVLAGSATTLITAAATYSAGAEIVVDLNGTAGRLYYNNALVGTTSSINSGLTATAHGLRSTDTGGIQLDDFVVYAKGTGGEYNVLNRYVNL